jgi:hypothetical protein
MARCQVPSSSAAREQTQRRWDTGLISSSAHLSHLSKAYLGGAVFSAEFQKGEESLVPGQGQHMSEQQGGWALEDCLEVLSLLFLRSSMGFCSNLIIGIGFHF